MKYETKWETTKDSTEDLYIETRIEDDFQQYKATSFHEKDVIDFLTDVKNFIIVKGKEYPYLIINSDTNVGLLYSKKAKNDKDLFCADWKVKRIY